MVISGGDSGESIAIEPISVPCEILICKKCGKEYPSRGLKDDGMCTKCHVDEVPLLNGPLDGMVIPNV